MVERLIIACDQGGFELKETLKAALENRGFAIVDLGTHSLESIDYPDKAHQLAQALAENERSLGLLICGTGIGISMAANRHPGVRAALCTDPFMAQMSREHNDANVLCLGGRVVGPGLAMAIVEAFLKAEFEGGRHERRVAKIEIA